MLQINISNTKKQPIYRQIADQIAGLIRSGALLPGDRLPAERELSTHLNLARGTVKKAYDSLAVQKMIVAAQGRGSIVAYPEYLNLDKDPAKKEVIDRARKHIYRLIEDFENAGIDYSEMHVFFRRCIDQKQAETTGISVAAVDCNPEALGIYHQQLSILAKISIDRYLLDELRKRKNVDRLLGQYDILLTTSNHINELQDLVPSLHKRCFPVAVAPTRKTLIALAKIPTDKRVGVFYRSRRFLEIIGVWLKRSGFFENFSSRSCENINSEQLISFVQDCDYLVVPPDFLDSLEAKCRQNLKMLKAEIIDFAYQIERGSLLHLEDTIKNIMNKSGTKP